MFQAGRGVVEGERSASEAPLRVAILAHRFPVISETFVGTLAADIAAAGHDLRILATDGTMPEGPVHDPEDAARLTGRIARAAPEGRLTPLQVLSMARATPGKAGHLVALAAADAVLPRNRLAVTRMMAREAPFDVVHCQFGYVGLVALRHRAYGTLRTRALVVHLRGSDITQFVEQNGPQVYATLFRRADLFIANCAHFRDRALALGCPPEKLTVIGSPIDTARFAPPEGRDASTDRPVRLVAVGRLVEKKGFADAIEAMALLLDRDVSVTLDILGDGPLRGDLERQIAAARLGGVVTLRGAATRAQVVAALHAADLALAPSVRAASGDEDAPVNTLKEAMATELPVIATRHGGIPELVIPGENGELVPERSPAALADAIAAMIRNRADWRRLGRAGRGKVVAEFDRRAILARTLSAYRTALARAGGTP